MDLAGMTEMEREKEMEREGERWRDRGRDNEQQADRDSEPSLNNYAKQRLFRWKTKEMIVDSSQVSVRAPA